MTVVAVLWRVGIMASECFDSLHRKAGPSNLSLLGAEIQPEPISLNFQSETPSVSLISSKSINHVLVYTSRLKVTLVLRVYICAYLFSSSHMTYGEKVMRKSHNIQQNQTWQSIPVVAVCTFLLLSSYKGSAGRLLRDPMIHKP